MYSQLKQHVDVLIPLLKKKPFESQSFSQTLHLVSPGVSKELYARQLGDAFFKEVAKDKDALQCLSNEAIVEAVLSAMLNDPETNAISSCFFFAPNSRSHALLYLFKSEDLAAARAVMNLLLRKNRFDIICGNSRVYPLLFFYYQKNSEFFLGFNSEKQVQLMSTKDFREQAQALDCFFHGEITKPLRISLPMILQFACEGWAEDGAASHPVFQRVLMAALSRKVNLELAHPFLDEDNFKELFLAQHAEEEREAFNKLFQKLPGLTEIDSRTRINILLKYFLMKKYSKLDALSNMVALIINYFFNLEDGSSGQIVIDTRYRHYHLMLFYADIIRYGDSDFLIGGRFLLPFIGFLCELENIPSKDAIDSLRILISLLVKRSSDPKNIEIAERFKQVAIKLKDKHGETLLCDYQHEIKKKLELERKKKIQFGVLNTFIIKGDLKLFVNQLAKSDLHKDDLIALLRSAISEDPELRKLRRHFCLELAKKLFNQEQDPILVFNLILNLELKTKDELFFEKIPEICLVDKWREDSKKIQEILEFYLPGFNFKNFGDFIKIYESLRMDWADEAKKSEEQVREILDDFSERRLTVSQADSDDKQRTELSTQLDALARMMAVAESKIEQTQVQKQAEIDKLRAQPGLVVYAEILASADCILISSHKKIKDLLGDVIEKVSQKLEDLSSAAALGEIKREPSSSSSSGSAVTEVIDYDQPSKENINTRALELCKFVKVKYKNRKEFDEKLSVLLPSENQLNDYRVIDDRGNYYNLYHAFFALLAVDPEALQQLDRDVSAKNREKLNWLLEAMMGAGRYVYFYESSPRNYTSRPLHFLFDYQDPKVADTNYSVAYQILNWLFEKKYFGLISGDDPGNKVCYPLFAAFYFQDIFPRLRLRFGASENPESEEASLAMGDISGAEETEEALEHFLTIKPAGPLSVSPEILMLLACFGWDGKAQQASAIIDRIFLKTLRMRRAVSQAYCSVDLSAVKKVFDRIPASDLPAFQNLVADFPNPAGQDAPILSVAVYQLLEGQWASVNLQAYHNLYFLVRQHLNPNSDLSSDKYFSVELAYVKKNWALIFAYIFVCGDLGQMPENFFQDFEFFVLQNENYLELLTSLILKRPYDVHVDKLCTIVSAATERRNDALFKQVTQYQSEQKLKLAKRLLEIQQPVFQVRQKIQDITRLQHVAELRHAIINISCEQVSKLLKLLGDSLKLEELNELWSLALAISKDRKHKAERRSILVDLFFVFAQHVGPVKAINQFLRVELGFQQDFLLEQASKDFLLINSALKFEISNLQSVLKPFIGEFKCDNGYANFRWAGKHYQAPRERKANGRQVQQAGGITESIIAVKPSPTKGKHHAQPPKPQPLILSGHQKRVLQEIENRFRKKLAVSPCNLSVAKLAAEQGHLVFDENELAGIGVKEQHQNLLEQLTRLQSALADIQALENALGAVWSEIAKRLQSLTEEQASQVKLFPRQWADLQIAEAARLKPLLEGKINLVEQQEARAKIVLEELEGSQEKIAKELEELMAEYHALQKKWQQEAEQNAQHVQAQLEDLKREFVSPASKVPSNEVIAATQQQAALLETQVTNLAGLFDVESRKISAFEASASIQINEISRKLNKIYNGKIPQDGPSLLAVEEVMGIHRELIKSIEVAKTAAVTQSIAATLHWQQLQQEQKFQLLAIKARYSQLNAQRQQEIDERETQCKKEIFDFNPKSAVDFYLRRKIEQDRYRELKVMIGSTRSWLESGVARLRELDILKKSESSELEKYQQEFGVDFTPPNSVARLIAFYENFIERMRDKLAYLVGLQSSIEGHLLLLEEKIRQLEESSRCFILQQECWDQAAAANLARVASLGLPECKIFSIPGESLPANLARMQDHERVLTQLVWNWEQESRDRQMQLNNSHPMTVMVTLQNQRKAILQGVNAPGSLNFRLDPAAFLNSHNQLICALDGLVQQALSDLRLVRAEIVSLSEKLGDYSAEDLDLVEITRSARMIFSQPEESVQDCLLELLTGFKGLPFGRN